MFPKEIEEENNNSDIDINNFFIKVSAISPLPSKYREYAQKLQFASRIGTNWSFDGLKIGQAIQTLTTILSAASENLNPLWS